MSGRAFEISPESFIRIFLEGTLILSNRADKLLVLSPEGKSIIQDFFDGKSQTEIAEKLSKQMGIPASETLGFVESFLSSLEEQVKPISIEESAIRPASPPATSPYAVKRYEIYGKQCAIRYGDPDAVMILHPLLAHLEGDMNREVECPLIFDLFRQNDDYIFYFQGREVVRGESLIYVKNVALFEIFASLYPEKSWLTVFHGSVVKKSGHALILCGFSGKGKSTLATYLVQKGFTLLSDDLAILESETTGVVATPYAISLKEDTWDILSHDHPEIASLKSRKIYDESLKFYRPFNGKAPDDSPGPVRRAYLLFINYEQGASTRISRLSSVDALKKIISIGAWVSHKEDHLRKFMTWIENAPAYEISYADLEAAEGKIHEIMDRHNADMFRTDTGFKDQVYPIRFGDGG